jgi:hypothetical protein
VAAATHCQRHTGICSDAHDFLDIARRRGLHNRTGPTFDDAIVDATKAIIVSVPRIKDSAVKMCAREIAHH